MTAWIARDKCGDLWIYFQLPPTKGWTTWVAQSENFNLLDSKLYYNEVTWDDTKPTEVEIIIKHKDK